MSQTIPSCDLKLGYTPTVFVAGRRQSIVFSSRCKGIAEWQVADTDDWRSDESKEPDRDGYYHYTLRATWHQAVTNEAGIRFRFRPLPVEDNEAQTVSLEVCVEDTRYPTLSAKNPVPPELWTQRTLTFALWAATALLGLWAIAVIVTDIWPAILLALAGQMGPSARQQLMAISWNCSLLVLSIVWLFVVLGGAEYHRKRIGRPESWRVLGVTLGAEVAILLAALFV